MRLAMGYEKMAQTRNASSAACRNLGLAHHTPSILADYCDVAPALPLASSPTPVCSTNCTDL